MKPDKKINWNFSGTPLGPRTWAEAGAKARGPRVAPERFQFFFVRFHEYHPRFSILSCENIREYHWKHQKYQWIPGHKIKKICVVSIEIPLWWYFGQKCSCSHCILNVIYLLYINIDLLTKRGSNHFHKTSFTIHYISFLPYNMAKKKSVSVAAFTVLEVCIKGVLIMVITSRINIQKGVWVSQFTGFWSIIVEF